MNRSKAFIIGAGLILALMTATLAQPVTGEDVELFRKVEGKPLIDGVTTNWLVQFPKSKWAEANVARKRMLEPRLSYVTATTDVAANQSYVFDILHLLYADLQVNAPRRMTLEDIYAAYKLGPDKVIRLKYDLGKIVDKEVLLGIERIRHEHDVKKLREQIAPPLPPKSPPPLPTSEELLRDKRNPKRRS